MMVHFFGILQPGLGRRHKAEDSPSKTSFFGTAEERLPLQGEPLKQKDQLEETDWERQRFLLQSFSQHF